MNIINPTLKVKTKKDISYTYDGFIIVSKKFKDFCTAFNYPFLEFVKLPSSPLFYWFKVNNIIGYDVEARKTRFLKFNERCNGYEEIIGATPVYLKKRKSLMTPFTEQIFVLVVMLRI